MKKDYRRKHLRRLAAAVCAALVAGAAGFAPVLYANPVLDSKDGAVSITGTTDMSITSTAANNLIKWVDFSIGKNEKVAFDGKNYLNYVTGSARSDILGTLTGGGNIYLVNPNGILIGDGAIVDVGSLHLSTKNLDVSQLTDYDKGLDLLNSATAAGDVINMGRLNATSITVEGNNITFKNAADVTSGATLGSDGKLTGGTQNNAVTLRANSNGEIHIGTAAGEEVNAVNDTQYKDVTLSVPTGWTINKYANDAMYMLVRNGYELQNMQNNLSGNYMLAKDIDMSGIGNFTPIGNSTPFTGKFDGLGHTLSNLVINKENDYYIGLFGVAGSGSVIENLKLSGGNIKGGYYVGLVGFNLGTVRRVYNDGVSVEGQTNVGGIVGRNRGTVTQVWNKGEVSGTTRVGGIVGCNDEGGTVEVAYNAGSVNGIAGNYSIAYIGGIAGQNINGSVKNVYNTGDVSAANGLYVGGIVGFNDATVSYAYNTGNVSAANGSNVGSIVGYGAATVEHAYDNPGNANVFADWDRDTDGTNSTAVWRQYGNNLPLLTAFLTRKDNIISKTEYNGSADVGATYTAASHNGAGITQVGENAINYVKDVSIASGGNSGSGGGSGGSSGGNSGGNTDGSTSETGAITPAPLAATERGILATVTETENIAAAAAAGARAEMSQAAAEAATSGTGTGPASAAAAAPQGFTWAAEGLIAIANDVNPAPQDALTPQSLGHALSVLQHGSGEEQTPGETGGAKGLEEAIETADLAIGTEITETDREVEAADEDKEARKKAEQG